MSAAVPSRAALDVETVVPTPQGTVRVGDLGRGAVVYGSDGHPVRVAQASPARRGRPCYAVLLSSGERIVVGAEQTWLAERRHLAGERREIRLTTAEVHETFRRHGPASLGIRIAPPVHAPTRRLPLAPYLLGVWLAAGVEGLHAVRGVDEEVLRRLVDTGARVFSSNDPDLHWISPPAAPRRSGSDLRSQLSRLGVLGYKHVPPAYLRGAIDQRRDLLAGLMDAGAHITDAGEIVFTARSRLMASGLRELVCSVGLRTWCRSAGDRVEVVLMPGERVFGVDRRDSQVRARCRLPRGLRPRHFVVGVEELRPRSVREVRVTADDGILLVGRGFVPLPGAEA
jgi:replicative DNA helicase